jgi:hypothetical protein
MTVVASFAGFAGVTLFNLETVRPAIPRRIPSIVVCSGCCVDSAGAAARVILQQLQECRVMSL